MSEAAEARVGRVEFTGSRHELLNILVRGYALMLPTIGLYRFWQTTWKRRFYWQNTVIDGDPLEYTGRATQLLMGFLFALAFFLPIYIGLFYLSMQDTDLVLIGYGVIAALVWFLSGYAIYRARDFRLSRTLWRGIRFDLRGHAWAYALRRFGWSILMLLTLGLVYPWMASSLWRYRYRHTWFGNRKFEVSGNWRIFAGPYFGALILNALAIGATLGWIFGTADFITVAGAVIPGPIGLAFCAGSILVLAFSFAWYRTRTTSRMLSTVTIGEATVTVSMPTGALFWQYVLYVAALAAMLIVLALVALIALGAVYAAASAGGQTPDATAIVGLFQLGWLNVALLIVLYLVVLGTLTLIAELILSFGWWALIARGTVIGNPDSLRSVRAASEDRALIGEGLADALNVGAY